MNYPSPAEIDAWCESLLREADGLDCTVTLHAPAAQQLPTTRHTPPPNYARFELADGDVFWGYWHPVASGGPAPLMIHVPGYAAEMSYHPELEADGCNVLHINPLGFWTPDGPDESRRRNGTWPVLPDTMLSKGRHGYRDWLRHALVAVRWASSQACVQSDRLATFGTSQGGGGALLLGSLLRARGLKAIAADVPFLTDYRLMARTQPPGAYSLVCDTLATMAESDLPAAWRALGFVDTISHAHRLTMPVLLTAGQEDVVTPPASIRALFERLPGTRSYTELAGQGHAYTMPFLYLARGWFRLYV